MRHFPLLLLFIPLIAGAQSAVRLAASDLLRKPLTAFTESSDGQKWEVTFSGSSAAQEALANGEVDAAIVATPDGQPPQGDFQVVPLAFQIAAIVVNDGNPVRELTIDQLRTFFSSENQQPRWGDLTTDVNWVNRQVNFHAYRDDASLALEIFRHLVLIDTKLREGVTYTDNLARLLALPPQDPAAVLLVPAAPLAPGTRTVFIAATSGSPAYPPTPENVTYGDYPLRLPFYLLVPRNSAAGGTAAEALLGSAFARALVAANYVALSEADRLTNLANVRAGGAR